jgi:hypothetical protein
LIEEEAEELALVGFDTVLVGAFLLVKDARLAIDQNTRDHLLATIRGEKATALGPSSDTT